MDEVKSLRDQAIQKLQEADALLRTAGIREDLAVLASKQQDISDARRHSEDENEYDETYFDCACCQEDHTVILKIKGPFRFQHQYSLIFENYYSYNGWSFWMKIKALYRSAKAIFWTGNDTWDIIIKNGEDLRRFKDVLKRLP